MNQTSLWIVIVVTAAWLGFLVGYAVSSHSGGATRLTDAPAAAAQPAGAGGYGR